MNEFDWIKAGLIILTIGIVVTVAGCALIGRCGEDEDEHGDAGV